MQELRSFCWSLIAVSLCAGVCLILAPDGRPSVRYLRFICALCITALIVTPLKNAIGGLSHTISIPDVTEYSQDAQNYPELLTAETARELEAEAEKYVSEKYGVKAVECKADIERTGEYEIRLNGMYVTIDTKSDYLLSEIKKSLSDTFGCEVYAKKTDKE